jgi:Sec-independent protein translocase protein TatA
MFGGFGVPELLIVLVIVLVLFGVGRISKIAGEMGSGSRVKWEVGFAHSRMDYKDPRMKQRRIAKKIPKKKQANNANKIRSS